MTNLAISICSALLTLIGFIYAYRTVFLIVGVFATKKFAPAEKKFRYGILIAARNEENVIKHLLDSINKQSYPSSLITTFVVADNCTDMTAKAARAHGAICYERTDRHRCTKGYALQYLLQKIRSDYGDVFDGYFIFDADNLLEYDYIEKMNDAFAAGEKIITSYRNSKNFDTNAISASYGFHWLRTARLENRGRSIFGMPIRIQGTGFLFSAELVKNGWQYVSLTEDRAFMSDAVIKGVRISYQHDAVFYDEQPTSLKIAMRQRLRWAKGHIDAFKETLLPLTKKLFCGNLFSRIAAFDMILFNLPRPVVTITANLAVLLLSGIVSPASILPATISLLAKYLGVIPMALFLTVTERKRMPHCGILRSAMLCFSFPIFDFIGDISIWRALFSHVEWEPIPHDAAIGIKDMRINR